VILEQIELLMSKKKDAERYNHIDVLERIAARK
jgi:hypothetical protein